jgi:hypothetical protein
MEHRELKACGARVSNLSAAQDIKATHEKLVNEVRSVTISFVNAILTFKFLFP